MGSLMLHASHVFEICALFMTKRRKNLGKIKTVLLNDVLQTFGKKTQIYYSTTAIWLQKLIAIQNNKELFDVTIEAKISLRKLAQCFLFIVYT